jgi:hypothetical protein
MPVSELVDFCKLSDVQHNVITQFIAEDFIFGFTHFHKGILQIEIL